MRAFQLKTFDGPRSLHHVEVPAPARRDDVIVDVAAIGINFPDLLTTRGAYQHLPSLPFVPGCEIAGTVSWAPAGSVWRSGDRVAGFVWDGGYAEQVAVPRSGLMRVPDDVALDLAAGMFVNCQTAHFALVRRARLQPGETVLVLGAAGGVGSAAVQVAKGLGARVVALVSRPSRAAVATAAGADEVLVARAGFAADVRRVAGESGVDVVVDPVGDWLFDEALRALAPEGRILIVGFAGGAIPAIRANRLLLRNVSAVGVAWGAFLAHEPGLVAAAGEELVEMIDSGAVRPMVGARFDFEEIPRALQALADGEIPGKAVASIATSAT